MSSPAAGRVYGRHSGYRNLNKHLTRHGLRQWQEGVPVFTEVRNLRPKTLDQTAAWVNRPGSAGPIEERAANLGAILATQAHWLTERLLDRQASDFEAGGGLSERLYRARTQKPPRTA
jgi:four helix bundle suffix protein